MKLLPILLLLAEPAAVQAQYYAAPYYYGINGDGNSVIIQGYNGPGGAVDIPSTISVNGVEFLVTSIGADAFSVGSNGGNNNFISVTIPGSVTSIGDFAFMDDSTLASVTIPNSVTSIGWDVFNCCTNLTSVAFPGSVTNFGNGGTFVNCSGLTNVTFANGLTSIGDQMFRSCSRLTSVTIPNSVTSIGYYAFYGCYGLTGAYFQGNAPSPDSDAFDGDNNATVYYLPGTTGWGLTFDGLPTALWLPQAQTSDGNFGVQANQFGFDITWASGQTVVVEACTNLANTNWCPVATNTLTSGSSYFSDPQWTNYPGRFYRLRAP